MKHCTELFCFADGVFQFKYYFSLVFLTLSSSFWNLPISSLSFLNIFILVVLKQLSCIPKVTFVRECYNGGTNFWGKDSILFIHAACVFIVRLRHLELVSQHRLLVLLSGLTFIAWVFGSLLLVIIPA